MTYNRSKIVSKEQRPYHKKTFVKPWITNEIKTLIKEKHALFKTYKCGGIDFETYNSQKIVFPKY